MPSLHFILVDYGHGKAWLEREPKDMDRTSTVNDIGAGQIENVECVLEVDMATCAARDVTAGIAAEVMTIWADEGEPASQAQTDFIERFCGMGAAAAFRRAA